MHPLVVLAFALVAVSHGAIFVRLADAPPLAVAAWRMGLAALVVVPLALAFARRRSPGRRAELAAAAAGGLLALHFATWIASLSYTSVAQSVVLVTTAPVWVAVLGAALGLVRLGAAMLAAIALCVAGSVVIGGADLLGGGSWLGNGLALAGAVCMGGYLLLAREAQRELDFLGYVARVYAAAALVLWAAVLATGTVVTGFERGTWLALGAIALVSQLLGHGGYNYALRHLSPAFVAVTLVGEPLLAALLAWWLLGEGVRAATWGGGALILAGIVLAARAGIAERRPRPTPGIASGAA